MLFLLKCCSPEKHKQQYSNCNLATALLGNIVFSIKNCFSPALLSVQCFMYLAYATNQSINMQFVINKFRSWSDSVFFILRDMPPKKKAVKKEKTELQKTLENFDNEDFIEESGCNTKVADSLELQLFDFLPDALGRFSEQVDNFLSSVKQ